MSDTDQTTADTPIVANQTTSSVPHTPNELEVTTAKDGNLLVNQPAAEPSNVTQDPVLVPVQTTSPLPDATTPPVTLEDPDPAVPTEEKPVLVTPPTATPIVVSDNEVDQSSSPTQVVDEIEVLSGEIQALEAKIDRLATNVSVDVPKSPETKTDTVKNVNLTTPPQTPAQPQESSGTTQNLYTPKGGKDDVTAETEETAVVGEDEGASGSAIGTIGEVLMIFGLIIFFIMAASPFAKEIVGTNIWDAIRTIGWPTAGLSLVIGLLLSLFSKGKGLLKLLAVILLLICAMMYLSISGNGSFLGPVQNFLSPLFSFYQ